MSTPVLSTVTKACRVLELFRDSPRVTVTNCSRSLGIPRASAHRLLLSLVSAGLVEQVDGGRYQLGLQMFEMGAHVPFRRHVHEASYRVLEALADAPGLSSEVAILHKDDALCLSQAHRSVDASQWATPGARRPLHATAAGKMLLAHAERDQILRLTSGGLTRITPHTIRHPAVLLEQLDLIRQQGFATEHEEFRIGRAAIAVPVMSSQGDVVAALSLDGPTRYFNGNAIGRRPALHRGSKAISNNLSSDEVQLARCVG